MAKVHDDNFKIISESYKEVEHPDFYADNLDNEKAEKLIDSLNKNSNLVRGIVLDKLNITDDNKEKIIKALTTHKTLELLVIKNADLTAVQPHLYELIEKNEALRKVTFSGCKLNDEALPGLIEAVEKNLSKGFALDFVNLNSNMITDKGAGQLIEFLDRTNHQVQFYINNNKTECITSDKMKELARKHDISKALKLVPDNQLNNVIELVKCEDFAKCEEIKGKMGDALKTSRVDSGVLDNLPRSLPYVTLTEELLNFIDKIVRGRLDASEQHSAPVVQSGNELTIDCNTLSLSGDSNNQDQDVS